MVKKVCMRQAYLAVSKRLRVNMHTIYSDVNGWKPFTMVEKKVKS
jgi:hypothetical protein